jgi:hypothetical protein
VHVGIVYPDGRIRVQHVDEYPNHDAFAAAAVAWHQGLLYFRATKDEAAVITPATDSNDIAAAQPA